MAAKNNQVLWRAVAMGAGLVTAAVTKKALGSAWQRATGSPPPGSPEHPEVGLATAVAWSFWPEPLSVWRKRSSRVRRSSPGAG